MSFPHTKLTLRTQTWALLLAVVLVMAACSADEPQDVQVLPVASEALERTREAMSDVPQFEFALAHPVGNTQLLGGLTLRRAQGRVISPNRLAVNAEADLGRVFVKVSAIVIDEQTWMTNPLTGNWAAVPREDSPFSFLDPVALVSNVLEQTFDPTYSPSGPVSDGDLLLDGKVPSEALRPLVGTVLPGAVLDVSMVIDGSTFHLRSARLTGRLQQGDEPEFIRHISLDGFDGVPAIEPPINP